MTKREIYQFLEQKQREKINGLHSAYEARRNQILQKVYSETGLPALVKQVQSQLTEADRLLRAWVEAHVDDNNVSHSENRYSLMGQLSFYASSTDALMKDLLRNSLSIHPVEAQALTKAHTVQCQTVRNTFRTVLTTVQKMSTAKQAAAYLKELGFDLSEIENPPEQPQGVSAASVDPQYLFVKAA